jgi:type VI secretion system protein ImpL
MKLIGRFFLMLLALVLLALVCWGLTLWLEWRPATAILLFFGALGLWLLYRVMRRLVVRASAAAGVAQADRLLRLRAAAASPRAVLVQRWKAAARTLRRSGLRRHGNPLDVLPWYLMIGRSGAGKTTALVRAGLATPLRQVDPNAVIQQTPNCDWWYFDDAVVVDCAGRYVEAESSEADRSEWAVMLEQLGRYRARAGLNGLVIAIDVRRLQQPDRDALAAEGQVLRERMEQLIRLFDVRFPVYLLVTQCDHIYGWEDWSLRLPPHTLGQAVGWLAPDESDGFLERAFETVGERLATLRLVVAQTPGAASPGVLMFPSEFAQLQAGLRVFVEACFGQHRYLEQPLLRGLFFSSARQAGGAASTVLPDALQPRPAHATGRAGWFLHDFFARVLPRDRDARRPAALRSPWRRARRHPVLLGWVLVCGMAISMMLVALRHNMRTVEGVRENYPFEQKFVGRIEKDANTLERISDALSVVELRNNAWVTEWMVDRTPVGDLENKLRRSYSRSYHDHAEPAAYSAFQELRRGVSLPERELLAAKIHNLVHYIRFIQARLDGAELQQLAQLPSLVPVDPDSPLSASLLRRLNRLDQASIAWNDDEEGFLGNRLTDSQSLLAQQAYGGQPALNWLVSLPTALSATDEVTLTTFWLQEGRAGAAAAAGPDTGAARKKQLTRVPPAFTHAGRQAIWRFLDEMGEAVPDTERFAQSRARFEVWYREQRLGAWRQFVTRFPEGEQLLAGEAAWRNTLIRAADARDPYSLLIDRLATEFADEPESVLPPWLLLARTLARLQHEQRAGAFVQASQAGSVFSTLNGLGGRALKQVIRSPGEAEGTLRRDFELRTRLRDFGAQLDTTMREALDGAGKAYPLAADFHALGVDPAVKTSSLRAAATAFQTLRNGSGQNQPGDAVVWNLVSGPLHLLISYVEQQASCTVQQDWESSVLWPLQSATSMTQIIDQLFGQQGTVWAFADGPAKPFLHRDATRIDLVETLGSRLPVTPAFLPLLNGAVNKRVEQLVKQQQIDVALQKQKLDLEKSQLEANQALKDAEQGIADATRELGALRAKSVPITITAQPTYVNPEAKAKPFQTTLTLQCAAAARVLNNFNFPVTERFDWSLAQCGEASLQIRVGDLVLTRRYPGELGIVRFIEEFKSGSFEFGATDFPGSRERLDALGVNRIRVRYDFEGQPELLKIAGRVAELDRQRTDLGAQRQRLSQTREAQALLEIRAPGAGGEPILEVSVPPRIGACWSKDSLVRSPQTLQALFRSLRDPASTVQGAGQPAVPGALPAR